MGLDVEEEEHSGNDEASLFIDKRRRRSPKTKKRIHSMRTENKLKYEFIFLVDFK